MVTQHDHEWVVFSTANRSTIKSLRALEQLTPTSRVEVILAILQGLNARNVQWLDNFLHNTRREIELAAAQAAATAEPATGEATRDLHEHEAHGN